MDLTKNIFFNTDKLVENSKVKISYTGKFFQDNSEKVFFHYGFGENWDNVKDIVMEKTELGFQTEIELISSETLNFCFFNENGEWDNNYNKNSKTFVYKKQKTTKSTIKHLKSKKKYYVRIRTYKTSNNKKVYSSGSKVKSVVTK